MDLLIYTLAILGPILLLAEDGSAAVMAMKAVASVEAQRAAVAARMLSLSSSSTRQHLRQ
jgi:hypothetical protein